MRKIRIVGGYTTQGRVTMGISEDACLMKNTNNARFK